MTLVQAIDEVLSGFGYVWQGHDLISCGAQMTLDGVWTGPHEAGDIVVFIRVPETDRHGVSRRLRALLMIVGAATVRPLTVLIGPIGKEDVLVAELRRLVRLVPINDGSRSILEKGLAFLAPLQIPRLSESVSGSHVLASQVLTDVSDAVRAHSLAEAATESSAAVEDVLRSWLTAAVEGGDRVE